MIDKKIYYCWFGHGEMSDLNKKCLDSWKVHCPDYEIIEINEDNYDVNCTPYSKEAYEHGNWSYVSNNARLEVLSKNSGFYLDTDVQLVKSLDSLRKYHNGFITEFITSQPDSGVLGCAEFPTLYKKAHEGLVPGAVLHKEFIKNLYQMYDIHGQSEIIGDDGFAILGEEYFPIAKSGLFTDKTIGIHYFEQTWTKGWVNVTDPFYPYQRAEVYFGNSMVHKDDNATIRVLIKNSKLTWKNYDIIGKLNYFFNPKVVKMVNKDFYAERIEYDKTKNYSNIFTTGGVVVSYEV